MELGLFEFFSTGPDGFDIVAERVAYEPPFSNVIDRAANLLRNEEKLVGAAAYALGKYIC
jgi:hypothetical protein